MARPGCATDPRLSDVPADRSCLHLGRNARACVACSPARRTGMTQTLQLGDLRIDRIVEAEVTLRPAREMLRGLTPEILDQHRSWLQPQAIDAEDNVRVMFTGCLVRTPHHTVLIDTC